MIVLSILLLTAAASSDCFIIGFNYGVKGVRIGNGSNALISSICFAGTFLSMLVGKLLGEVLSDRFTGLIGGAVFFCLGLYMLFSVLVPKRRVVKHYSENPEVVDKDASRVIEPRESCFIGLLLTLNNIGLGIGAGIAGIPLLVTPAACALCSFVFINTGCILGGRITNTRLSGWLELLSAALILLLGCREILVYLL